MGGERSGAASPNKREELGEEGAPRTFRGEEKEQESRGVGESNPRTKTSTSKERERGIVKGTTGAIADNEVFWHGVPILLSLFGDSLLPFGRLSSVTPLFS